MPLLDIHNLSVHFLQQNATVQAVRSLSLSIEEGETHCLVGESGCGKSVASFAVMRLIQKPGEIVGGSVVFNGRDLLTLSEDEMRSVRGREIAMIFQDPMNSLNPVYRCGDQIAEVLKLYRGLTSQAAQAEVVRLLDLVKIPDAAKRARQYPHELSGGMRQRVMIAMALACRPRLLIADEPTTALDVTVQAQILTLLSELQKEFAMALLFITHDLGVVAGIAHKITVLYAGSVVESGDAEAVFTRRSHPYTNGLFNAIPIIGQQKRKLTAIEGTVPEPTEIIRGCAFAPRCQNVTEQCVVEKPPFAGTGSHHWYCFNPMKPE